jgi:hypothetical protein
MFGAHHTIFDADPLVYNYATAFHTLFNKRRSLQTWH